MGWRLPGPLAISRWSFLFMLDSSKPMKGIHAGWIYLIVFVLTGCSAGSSLAPAGDAGVTLAPGAAPVAEDAHDPTSFFTGAPGQEIASVSEAGASVPHFNDAHLHLLNYVQEGPAVREYLDMVGDRVGRTALFGIPLQQKWDYFVSGDRAPDYYLRSDAALYYYSFVDAAIAHQYLSLSDAERQRVDPMITGFNPTDMYAADHIERVLRTFPGVFAGIGEFAIHKEFVSSKITGHTASLHNPALDRILAKAAEIGLVVILHCDIANVRPGEEPDHYEDLLRVFAAHPQAAIVWAHTGLGRFVAPSREHVELLDRMLSDSRYQHVMLDISWDEVAKYLVKDDETVDAWAALIAKHPMRFLFGTDSVAPANWEAYAHTHTMYQPLWNRLAPTVRAQVERLNYERVFDAAIPRVRAWEAEQPMATLDDEGFVSVFNGVDLTGWTGNTEGYAVEDGSLVCLKDGGGNLYIDKEYSDFHLRFAFKLESGANNGVGIRAEQGKDAAYYGMEIQILDDTAPEYADLQPWQYHGSVYGVAPAHRGYQKPLGEWNEQEIAAQGNHITVMLNGTVIVDVDLEQEGGSGTIDGREHPGLFNPSGYIGFLGHGHRIEFRAIRIKAL